MKKKKAFLSLIAISLFLVGCSDDSIDLNTHSVTYLNYDDTVLYTTFVGNGQESVYKGKEPTKPASSTNSYKFTGWSDPLINIEENKVVKALYDTMATVTFKNYDATTLYSTTIKQGENAVYQGETPTKPINGDVSYDFDGWDVDLRNVRINTTATAQFKEASSYAITFVNYDNTVLQSGRVKAYTMPVYSGDTPTKPKEETGDYVFTGWSPELTLAVSDATYIAQYKFVKDQSKTVATVHYSFDSEENAYQVDSFEKDGVNVNIKETYDDGTNGEHPVYCVSFSNDTSITLNQIVNLPASVKAIIYGNNSDITAINVDENSKNACSVDGVLFSKDKKTLYMFPSGRTGNYKLPEETTKVTDFAFSHCVLITIELNKNLNSMTGYAFYDTRKLMKFIPGDENENFSVNAGVLFNKNQDLLVSIPGDYFETDYVVPSTVVAIGTYAFGNVNFFNTLTLDDNLEVINDDAFYGLSVDTINIPKMVKTFSAFTIADLGANSYTVDKDNLYYTMVDNVLYNKDETTIISVPSRADIKDLVIADGTITIGSYSIGSLNTETVKIPSSVTTIETNAFYRFPNISKLFIPKTVTTIESNIFSDINVNKELVIYCEATEKPSGWDDNWNNLNLSVVWGATNPNA